MACVRAQTIEKMFARTGHKIDYMGLI